MKGACMEKKNGISSQGDTSHLDTGPATHFNRTAALATQSDQTPPCVLGPDW